MGCSTSRTVTTAIVSNPKPTSAPDTIKSYFTETESLLPNRIRELFQRYFMHQTTAALLIDLKFINLSGPSLSALQIILPCFQKIHALNLWKTRLGNEGCVILAAMLENFPLLRFLSLADNKITLKGLEAVSQKFGVVPELETLELHVNVFADDCAMVLKERLPRLKKLKTICLDECEMSGKGLREVVMTLAGMKEIERVSLDYNQISEEISGQMVQIVGKMKKLRRLSAQHTGITVWAQEELRRTYLEVMFSFA
jgi:hypothetical protein